AYSQMHHEHLVQFLERHGIRRSAHRGILAHHPLDHPGIDNPHLTELRQPGDLPIEVVELLRPPGDGKRVLRLTHGCASSSLFRRPRVASAGRSPASASTSLAIDSSSSRPDANSLCLPVTRFSSLPASASGFASPRTFNT